MTEPFLSEFSPSEKSYEITSAIPCPLEIIISTQTSKRWFLFFNFSFSYPCRENCYEKLGEKFSHHILLFCTIFLFKSSWKIIGIATNFTFEYQSNIAITGDLFMLFVQCQRHSISKSKIIKTFYNEADVAAMGLFYFHTKLVFNKVIIHHTIHASNFLHLFHKQICKYLKTVDI